MPGLLVIPDALAWGKLNDFETLFWLEVGENHKPRREILMDLNRRLRAAHAFSVRTGVRLVFALLGPRWVRDEARWGSREAARFLTVVTGDWHGFGQLREMWH